MTKRFESNEPMSSYNIYDTVHLFALPFGNGFSSLPIKKKKNGDVQEEEEEENLRVFSFWWVYSSVPPPFFFCPAIEGTACLNYTTTESDRIMLTGFSLFLSRAIVYDIVVSLDRCLEKTKHKNMRSSSSWERICAHTHGRGEWINNNNITAVQ